MRKSIVTRPLPPGPDELDALHPVLRRIFRARGVSSPRELTYELDRLERPHRLPGMAEAAERVADAVEQGRRILVVGDFDCDGATSSALMLLALRAMGAASVDYLVPNRFDYGYGLTPEIVEIAAERRPDLLITVDNGVSSLRGVARARELGMQVVVTDHHLPGATLPEADAMVNPNLEPGHPLSATAGVGVAFYLLLAVRAELRGRGWFAGRPEPNMAEWLDLVALGTVADVVPLAYNNRILVHQGLRRIAAGRCRPGILALLELAGRDHRTIRAQDLGFVLGPRINAAGRLDDISVGIECLLADTLEEARPLAARLDAHNRERRRIEEEMKRQAEAHLESLTLERDALPWGLCLHHDDWHQGVIGILASRVKERYLRPVIAFASGGEGTLKGSARSIPGFHIRDALEEVSARHPGLIRRFGGHAMAAGLTLEADAFDEFARRFDEVARRHLRPEDLEPVILSDGEIEPEHLGLELALELSRAGPWGQGFPEPLFHGEFRVERQQLLKEKHWKLAVRPAGGDQVLDAIGFNLADSFPEAVPERVLLAYRLEVNEFRGNIDPRLQIVHLESL